MAIPENYSVIPGTGQAVAAAVVQAAKDAGVSQGAVTFSPIQGGFIVPDEVAAKFKAPKDTDGSDVNVPASKLKVDPPDESVGFHRDFADGEGEKAEPEKKTSRKSD